MDTSYTLIDVIRVITANWKKIALVTAFGAIIGLVSALLKPNYYQATTTFFPASEDLSKHHKIFGGDKNINYYGNKQDLDRLLTQGNSGKLKSDLIRQFNLFERYDIDSTSQDGMYRVFLKLNKLFDLKRTERDALELSIEDKDPFIAAEMANYSREKIGTFSSDVIKTNQKSLMTQLRNTIERDQKSVTGLNDSLAYLRNKYNIYNSAAQSEHLSEYITTAQSNLARDKAKLKYYKNHPVQIRDTIMILEAKVAGFQEKLKSLTKKSGGYFNLESYRDGLPQFEQISDMYGKELSQLNYDILLLNQMEQIYNSHFLSIQLIEEATVPLIKSRPHRSVIVLGSAFLAFIFGVLVVILIEFWRRLK